MKVSIICFLLIVTLITSYSCKNEPSIVNTSVTISDSVLIDTIPITDRKNEEMVESNRLKFEKVDGINIMYNGDEKFNTGLYDLEDIGQLATKNKLPYLILSGRDCRDCDENISIYIISPSDFLLNVREKPRYSYPGKEIDYATNKLVFESRMFYGNCSFSENSVIWLQRNFSNNAWDTSLFVVKVFNDTLNEAKIVNPYEIQNALNKLSSCKELRGIENTIEP
jgi:hypothetical protein